MPREKNAMVLSLRKAPKSGETATRMACEEFGETQSINGLQ
ncbi:hypothetical protein ACCT30_36185 [Rhizobium ruizarguesonis]|jgi:hypothetical protein